MRGRRPKPTAIKRATGNPGKRPLNDHEPEPAIGLGKPTKQLSKLAKRVWKDLAPRLEALQVGTDADREAFSLLCEAYANWLELIVAARDPLGNTIHLVEVFGQMVPNPRLKRADAEAAKIVKLLGEFGLTPSARSRVKIPDGDDADTAAGLMAPAPRPVRPPAGAGIAGNE